MREFYTREFKKPYTLSDEGFSLMLVGSSGAGKTTWIEKAIESGFIPLPTSIDYRTPNEACDLKNESCSRWDDKFPEIPIQYNSTLPTREEYREYEEGDLCIIDDWGSEAIKNKAFVFAVEALRRKKKFSIILVLQYFFVCAGPETQTVKNQFDVRYFLFFF